MNKLACLPVLLAALVTGGCFKLASESAVNKDGSATMKVSMAYKTEVLAMLKAQIEQAVELMGEDNPQIAKAKAGLEKLESSFDEKKITEEWKKLGVEVAKSAAIDKDGWKGFEIEGSTKNLIEYNRKHADARKAAAGDEADSPMPGVSARGMSLPRLPKFYKTDQPNVAKVVMAWRDSSGQDDKMAMLEKMSDEEREDINSKLEMARSQIPIDDIKVEMRVKLPGKILSVSNAKQDGENVMVFQFLGSSLNADSLSKMGQSPSATIQFDPKEFTIALEDEPKAAESKPASKKAEKPKKDEEEKKKDEDKDK